MASCKNLLLFVSGFHHSGTTLMQHMLLRELGYNTTVRFPEMRPRSCNPVEVLKFPSNTVAAVQSLRDIPAPVVWMERDGPNTLWSLMKRQNRTDVGSLHQLGHQMCSVKCEARKHNFKFVYLHSLCKSGRVPTDLSRYLHPLRKLQDVPPSIDHEARRGYQATHSVYADDYDLCFREADPSLHQSLEQYANCKCQG